MAVLKVGVLESGVNRRSTGFATRRVSFVAMPPCRTLPCSDVLRWPVYGLSLLSHGADLRHPPIGEVHPKMGTSFEAAHQPAQCAASD